MKTFCLPSLVVIFFILNLCGFVYGQVQLLKDLNPGFTFAGSYPTLYVTIGDVVYFSATERVNGSELWRSNGTETGTYMIKDINPGSASSNISDMVAVGNIIYFSAEDGIHGKELWRSDGTEIGTYMVKDMVAGSGSGDPKELTNVNGVLFFASQGVEGSYGHELFVSDGTASGTHLVKQIGSIDGAEPSSLTAINGILYFMAMDQNYGSNLYRSDGTADGTYPLYALYYADNFTLFNGDIYFNAIATYGSSDEELWKTDGTPGGTVLVKDIWPGTHGSYPRGFKVYNGYLYINASTSENGAELWRTDGTSDGTVLFKEFEAGSWGGNPEYFTEFNNILYFKAASDTYGEELFRTDGTLAGTYMVKDIYPGTNYSTPEKLTVADNILFFVATDPDNGRALWKTDGTETGTVLVKSFPGTYFPDIKNLIAGNTKLYFTASDQGDEINGNFEVWKSDGTGQGTFIVKDIAKNNNDSDPYFSVVNNQLYVLSDILWKKWWKSDGTSSGTILFDTLCYPPSYLTQLGNNQFIFSSDSIIASVGGGWEPWVSDGTYAGTRMLADIYPGKESSYPGGFTKFGNLAFFYTAAFGNKIYITDGKSLGTVPLKDENNNEILARIGGWSTVILNNRLYFETGTGNLSYSDGTPAGTKVFTNTDNVQELTLLNTDLIFSAQDDTHGKEIWISDGTETGTHIIFDINPGNKNSTPTNLTKAGNYVFTDAVCDGYGNELWVTDGTDKGTKMVKDIIPGSDGTSFSDFIEYKSLLFFVTDDKIHGKELWRSNGEESGTSIFADLFPGPAGSDPANLVVYNGILYFTALSESYGYELWRTDGTACGTYPITSDNLFQPGEDIKLTGFNNNLYFVANHPDFGKEPFYLDLSTVNTSLFTINVHKNSEISCYNTTDGIIEVTAAGGSGTLQYSIDNQTFQADPVFKNLAPGSYTVYIRDHNGCSGQANPVTFSNPPAITAQAQVTQNISCYGNNDGIIQVNASGGSGNFSYSIDNGLTFQDDHNFQNLIKGNYVFIIKDKNGCSFTTPSLALNQPAPVYWYADADHDGFGNIANRVIACTKPAGYVADSLDCNDADPLVNPDKVWYRDADGDHFGDPSTTVKSCTQPAGYVNDNTDCNDNNASVNPNTKWYLDADHDGFGNINVSQVSCLQPQNYVRNSTDCDDSNSSLYPGKIWYRDNDGDTFGDMNVTQVSCTQPAGYVDNGLDCNDNDKNILNGIMWYADADGDGYGNPAQSLMTCTQPAGYVTNNLDCNDSDSTVNPDKTWYADADHDSYGNPDISKKSCLQPAGYVDNNKDCDDTNSNAAIPALWYPDADHDGFGNSNLGALFCTQPAGYVADSTDCDDMDPDVHPGAPAKVDGKDNNCVGTALDDQSLTFTAIADQVDNRAVLQLTATASSGLAITYSATGPASLNGSQLTLTGAGMVTITASQPGNIDFHPAGNVTVSFCVNPLPVITNIQGGSTEITLQSNYTSGNQWYYENSVIPSATGLTHDVLLSGGYKLQVNVGGCIGISDVYEAILTGLETTVKTGDIRIYPNPSREIIIVKWQGKTDETYEVRIYNTQGTIINQYTVKDNKAESGIEIRVSDLSKGLYLIKVAGTSEVFTEKFQKE